LLGNAYFAVTSKKHCSSYISPLGEPDGLNARAIFQLAEQDWLNWSNDKDYGIPLY